MFPLKKMGHLSETPLVIYEEEKANDRTTP